MSSTGSLSPYGTAMPPALTSSMTRTSAAASTTDIGSASTTRTAPPASRSRTRSASSTSSRTATATQDATQTQSPSILLPGESRSQTPTPSPTPTPAPFSLSIGTVDGGGGLGDDGVLLLSDSLPPALIRLVLSRCPGVPGQLMPTLACGTVADGVAENEPLLHVAYLPSSTMALPCSIDGGQGITLPMSLQLLPPYATPGFSGVVSCSLTGADGAAMGTVSLGVTVAATLWPTFDDVIIVSESGISRSIGGFGPGNVNSTAALLAAAAESPQRARARALDGSGASGSAVNPMFSSAAVLAAMTRVWGGVEIPPDDVRPFSLTLFGSTPFVLRSRQRAFTSDTRVRVGAVLCNGTVASADGVWLVTTAPDPALLCGTASATAGCAYASLVIQNPPFVDLATGRVLGASLSCPPFCSNAIGGGLFPLAVASGNATTAAFVPANLDASSRAAVAIDFAATGSTGVTAARISAIASSSGMFFSASCSDSGLFTDPSTGACTNSSDPAFSFCAFGSGGACRACPRGAMCPGGNRAWPQRGYWSAAESSATVLSCIQPDALRKCLGWNAALGTAQCGAPYRQGSYLCSGDMGRGLAVASLPIERLLHSLFLSCTTCHAIPLRCTARSLRAGLLFGR